MTDTTAVPTVAERLRRVSRIVQRHWILLVGLTVATGAAAVLFGAGGAQRYSATSKLVLDNSQLVGVVSNAALVPNPDPERDINTKVALVVSRPVGQAVATRLHLRMPLARLLAGVQAQPEGTSNIVDVTATTANPAGARAVANAFAAEYVRYRRSLARSALISAATAIRQTLATPTAQRPAGTTTATLAGQLRDIDTVLATQTGGATVVAPAVQVTASTSRSPLALAGVGGLVGLLAAVAVLALLEVTNRTLKDGEDVASAFPVRLLAEVPRPRFGARSSLMADAGRRQTEAYDNLAGQVLLARRRRDLQTLMVTSPGAADGKTSVTMGLARALARLDHRVVVIESDAGASSRALAAGEPSLPISIRTVADGEPTSNGSGPAGALVGLVQDSREQADFVLLDGPSIHRLHSAPGLTNDVDAVLMVSRLRWTARESLRNALDVLDAFGLRLLGLVLTDSVGLSTVASGVSGAVIPLDISANGADRNGASSRRARRNGAEVQTVTSAHVRASYDDGRTT